MNRARELEVVEQLRSAIVCTKGRLFDAALGHLRVAERLIEKDRLEYSLVELRDATPIAFDDIADRLGSEF